MVQPLSLKELTIEGLREQSLEVRLIFFFTLSNKGSFVTALQQGNLHNLSYVSFFVSVFLPTTTFHVMTRKGKRDLKLRYREVRPRPPAS